MYVYVPFQGCEIPALPPYYVQGIASIGGAVLSSFAFSVVFDATRKDPWYKKLAKYAIIAYKGVVTPLAMITTLITHFGHSSTSGFWDGYQCFGLAWSLKPWFFHATVSAVQFGVLRSQYDSDAAKDRFIDLVHCPVIKLCIELEDRGQLTSGPCDSLTSEAKEKCQEVVDEAWEVAIQDQSFPKPTSLYAETPVEDPTPNVDGLWIVTTKDDACKKATKLAKDEILTGLEVAQSFLKYMEEEEDEPTWLAYCEWRDMASEEGDLAHFWECYLHILGCVVTFVMVTYFPLTIPFFITNVFPASLIYLPLVLAFSCAFGCFYCCAFCCTMICTGNRILTDDDEETTQSRVEADQKVLGMMQVSRRSFIKYSKVYAVPFLFIVWFAVQALATMSIYFFRGEGWFASLVITFSERKGQDYWWNLSKSAARSVEKASAWLTFLNYFG